MMATMMRFTALAHFTDGSIKTTAHDPVSLFAVDAAGACRKWFWRLSEADRARCVEVTVSAWQLTHRAAWEAYSGPPVTRAFAMATVPPHPPTHATEPRPS